MLAEHLIRGQHDFVEELVNATVDDVNGRPDVWHDYERQATRALGFGLRSHVEGLFEDFFFAPVSDRSNARMIADVGSLWRVQWDEVAASVFEACDVKLEPPDEA